jgi:hypothetical protein
MRVTSHAVCHFACWVYDIPLMKMISTDNNQPEKPMSMVTIFVTLPTPII